MDLNSIIAIERPGDRSAFEGLTNPPRAGDAWLAGGTWLFSEPQPNLRRLIDLSLFDWIPLEVNAVGLSISATCTISTFAAFKAPSHWLASPLFEQCCHSFLAGFKVWNMATFGGNVCQALPAGPMISLCAALDGICTIWMPGGGSRQLPMLDFVKGPMHNDLKPGELLRSIDLPLATLLRQTSFRRISLTNLGRSAALLIGTLSLDGAFDLTVTASTPRPVKLSFAAMPGQRELARVLAADIPDDLYYDDVHGRPDWRRHMTMLFAEEIRRELLVSARA